MTLRAGVTHLISRRRRLLGWLAAGIGVLLLLVMGYLAGVHWLFNSSWLQQRLSQLPGVSVSWSEASITSLDRLEVRDLSIRRADETLDVALEVERARLHLSWWALLFGRLEVRSLEAQGLRSLDVNEHRLVASASSRVRVDDLVVDEENLGIARMELALAQALVQRRQGVEDYQTLARDIRLQGRFSLATFRPDQAPGLAALAFLSGDIDLSAQADAWDVFNPYLNELDGLRLAGKGGLEGQLAIENGVLLAGSELTLSSPQLVLALEEKALFATDTASVKNNVSLSSSKEENRYYRLEGGGQVTARAVKQGDTVTTRLALTLEKMRMFDLAGGGSSQQLLSKERIPKQRLPKERLREESYFLVSERFRLDVSLAQLNLAAPPRELNTAALIWQGANLPNANVLTRYLPENLPFDLHGGKAGLDGRLDYQSGRLKGGFELRGNNVDLTLLGRRVASELGLDVKLVELNLQQRRLDLSGTRLRLEANNPGSASLQTELLLREARLGLTDTSSTSATTAVLPLAGKIVLQGRVAELGFLDGFLPEAHGLAVRGNGLMEAELILQGESLLPGSRLWISADPLALSFLDYEASGNGRLEAAINKTSGNVDLRIALPSFALRGQESSISHVSGRHLLIESTLPATVLDGKLNDAIKSTSPTLADQVTRISLPQVDVPDLSLYNVYLPQDAGIEMLSGQASLAANLDLHGYQARGDLSLRAFDAALRVGDQRMRGDLWLDARLTEGDLQQRRFNVSGSTLRLDNLSRRKGDQLHQVVESGWWVELGLDEGQLIWAQPLNLDARLALSMRDSGFPLRLLLEEARQREWLGRLLTVHNIQGSAQLQLTDDDLTLREARLTGEQLEILADLVRHDETLNGALYAGYKALGLGLDINDGQVRLQLIKPRRWYEQVRHLSAVELDLDSPTLQGSKEQMPEEPSDGEWYRALPQSPSNP